MASFMRRERQEASSTPRCEPEILSSNRRLQRSNSAQSDLALAAGAARR